MNHPVRIHEVKSWQEKRRFLRFPYRLYAEDPWWVAPLWFAEKARWNPKKNPALRSRWTARFLAVRGVRVVGRVAAVVDEEFAEAWWPESGFFGFFECEDDREAAVALFRASEDALQRRGCASVLGPVNLTTNEEVGFLVDGWGIRPSILSPYNPSYYPEMAAEAGYRPVRDYLAFRWTPASRASESIQRLLRAAEGRAATARSADRGRLTVRAFRKDDWDAEIAILHRLYNQTFEGLWGFTPMSADEFRFQAVSFRSFFEPSLIAIAEDPGGPIGFGVMLPDINEVLAKVSGRLLPVGWIQLLRGVKRIRTARFLIMGVLPGRRGQGVAPLMSAHLASMARAKSIRWADISLVQSTNKKMIHVAESMGCEPIRRFRLVGREI